MNQLWQLMAVFSYLSLLTIGGGMAAFPELKELTVNVHHWLTMKQLIHLYSVGQMAPGPNMMVVAAIGDQVAGLLGALLTVLAFFLPTALLTYWIGQIWDKLEKWPWRNSIQRGLAPVSIGLLIAGCMTLAFEAVTGWITMAISACVFAILLRSKTNPAVLVLISAGIGVYLLRGS